MTSLVENPESTGAAEDVAPPVGIIGDGAPLASDATIPLFKVAMAESAPDAVAAVLRSGYIGQGPKVEELEARLVEVVGNPRSMTVNSATSGLHLALHLMRGVTAADGRAGLADGDEVLASPLTCTATNWPILANRLRIKWVDVDPANCNIDLDDLEAKITPTTRAVMLVHWGGYPVDLERLDGVLDRAQERFGFRPVVVEDCAHAWGSTYHGTHLGTHGNAAVFSFQAIKHFTSGDGGLLAVPDQDLYRRGKLLRWYGIDREGERADFRCEADVTEFGFKFHMNDINAAIGLANLDIIDSVVRRHQANAAAYDEAFDGVDGVRLMERAPDRTSASWLYTMAVERRDDFMRMMAGRNIAVSRVHERNDIHSTVAEFTTELPRLDALVAEMICIPVGWWVTPDQRDRVIDAVRSGW